jgi:hypothetical protein
MVCDSGKSPQRLDGRGFILRFIETLFVACSMRRTPLQAWYLSTTDRIEKYRTSVVLTRGLHGVIQQKERRTVHSNFRRQFIFPIDLSEEKKV